MVRMRDKPWLITGGSWLTVRSREHIECEVVAARKRIVNSIRWFVVVISWAMKTEQITLDECTYFTEVMVYRKDGGLW